MGECGGGETPKEVNTEIERNAREGKTDGQQQRMSLKAKESFHEGEEQEQGGVQGAWGAVNGARGKEK